MVRSIMINREKGEGHDHLYSMMTMENMSGLPTLPLYQIHHYEYFITEFPETIATRIEGSLQHGINGWGIATNSTQIGHGWNIKRETLTKKNHDRSKNNTIKKELVKAYRGILNDISKTAIWIELKGRKVIVEIEDRNHCGMYDIWFEFEIDSHALFMWYLCEDMRFILKQFAEELGKSKVF